MRKDIKRNKTESDDEVNKRSRFAINVSDHPSSFPRPSSSRLKFREVPVALSEQSFKGFKTQSHLRFLVLQATLSNSFKLLVM